MTQDSLPLPAARVTVRPYRVLSPGDMFELPEDRTDWLVNNLLPTVGTSLVGASPKCGKSVLTRQLCAFVSQGKPFLGREVKRGKALYMSTQEQPGKIADHFRDLGCDSETMPLTIAGEGMDPHSALERLSVTLAEFPELTLVVVDMVADLLPLRDSNDYTEMNKQFRKLRYLAVEQHTHVCVTHHTKKSLTENAANAFIGSAAIAGSVDQLIRLNTDSRGQRSIDTQQRYGDAIPHTLLDWNPDQRAFYLGAGIEEVRAQQKEATGTRILQAISRVTIEHPGRTKEELLSYVTGKTTELHKAFNRLYAEGHLARSGIGGKGDPYTYKLTDDSSTNPAQAA